MKSSITQIERRFDLSSTHIGLIDGSFEMGNANLYTNLRVIHFKHSGIVKLLGFLSPPYLPN